MGVLASMVREWLYEILPENAAELASNRLTVVVTKMPDFRVQTITKFETKVSGMLYAVVTAVESLNNIPSS